eukprot:4363590-Prymnesium_polylepis.1
MGCYQPTPAVSGTNLRQALLASIVLKSCHVRTPACKPPGPARLRPHPAHCDNCVLVECVADDCPFDEDRRGATVSVPILVAGDFPPPSPPARALIPEVRLGMLLA